MKEEGRKEDKAESNNSGRRKRGVKRNGKKWRTHKN
jgi:hypothetical protein